MNANEILRKYEDANEMHFHEVDRKWIIQAMEEYAVLRQPPVMPALQHSDAMCFHECPNCNCRCNCSSQPCSCCNEA